MNRFRVFANRVLELRIPIGAVRIPSVAWRIAFVALSIAFVASSIAFVALQASKYRHTIASGEWRDPFAEWRAAIPELLVRVLALPIAIPGPSGAFSEARNAPFRRPIAFFTSRIAGGYM